MLVRTAGGFYFVRFLLGAFEAGLVPGAVLYLTYWFPARRRAEMVGPCGDTHPAVHAAPALNTAS
jgi:MFS family permease